MGSLIGTLLFTMVLVVVAVAAAPLRSLAAEPEAGDSLALDDVGAWGEAPDTAQRGGSHARHSR